MNQDDINEYYNIDFENIIDIGMLHTFMKEKFNKFNIQIKYNKFIYEIINDKNINFFHIWISLEELKSNGIYFFNDIKVRATLFIDRECNFDSKKIIKLFYYMSQKLNSKIYIMMEDIEKNLSELSCFCAWCIDKYKRKIMFDSQEFYDDYKSKYCDYII